MENCFRELKELDKETRRERIAYAEQLLKRLQPGPKQLESANALSEILYEQQMQREAKRERERVEREQSIREGNMIRMQAQQWIDDQIEQMRKYRERCAEYKRVIFHDIDARTKERLIASQKLIELEQMERDANEQQMQNQLRKEREMSQQRREQFRSEVLKSMQHAMQGKRSEFNPKWHRRRTMAHKIDSLLSNFVELMAKSEEEQRQIDEYIDRKWSEEMQRKRDRIIERRQRTAYRQKLATEVFDKQPDVESFEDECYRRAVAELAVQWKQRQTARSKHLQDMRKERIENHTKEMERIQKLKESELVLRSAEVRNRLDNEGIDLVQECQRRAERTRKVKELQALIRSQIETRKEWQSKQLAKDRADTNRVIHDAIEQEDQTFLNLSKKLVNAAKRNGRPIFPLVKVILDYQKQHRLLPPKNVLPHLKSKIKLQMSSGEHQRY